jgi:hypothetical protein
MAVILASGAARADDAYVCDGGRLVYARPETLEKLKQTDPCIAGYYGIDLRAGPAKSNAAVASQAAPQTEKLAPSQAVSRDRAKPAAPANGVEAKPALKSSVNLVVPGSSPAGDFRSVRILNAQPGSNVVYRHDK